jgi:hypothetical protein
MTNKPAENFQTLPLEWIPCKNLSVVWIEAQRPLDKKWAQKIANEFDPDLFDPLLVTSKDGNGMYHVVKGQHRKAALQTKYGEDEKAPCYVAPITDAARAAELLLKSNRNVKPMHPVHAFNCAVTAKYPDEGAVKRIAKDCGYRIAIGNVNGYITSVGSLLWIYRRFGNKVLFDTLEVISGTFGYDHGAVQSPLIRAYGSFLTEAPKADLAHLKTVVAGKYSPGQLLAAGRAEAEAVRCDVVTGIKRILIKAYNKGRRNRVAV